MSTSIDSLDIQISAQAKNAEKTLGNLNKKLETLSTTLKTVNGSRLTGLADGVSKLAASMQEMNVVKKTDFNRLANGLKQLGESSKSISLIGSFKFSALAIGMNKLGTSAQTISNINVSKINSFANSIAKFSSVDVSRLKKVATELPSVVSSLNRMGVVSQNAQQVGILASNISKLGNKSVQTAIANIPQLATAMKDLVTTLSSVPKVSQNLIDMTNALANLANQGGRIGSTSNSLVNGLNNVSNASIRARKSTFNLASAFGKFYASYFLVIRGIKSLWSSIESTSDYLEAYNFLDVSLTKIGKDWSQQFEKYGYESAEAYAESFKAKLNDDLKKLSGVQIEIDAEGKGLLSETGLKNLGLDIEEVTQYMAQLVSVTNSVGQTGETSLATASAFSKLAGDISSLFNVDYSTVASNLQSGLIGQSRALYKYGIDITNATLQTYAYELGLSKTVTEMTQAEKMQLRMIAILDQSRVSWGDLANTINQPANAIRVFKNQLSELAQVIGQLFIPLVSKIVPVLSGITIAIKRLASTIAGFFGIKLEIADASQSFYDIEEDVYDVGDAVDSTTDSVKKLKNQLAGFDKLNVLTTSQTSGANNGTGTSGGGAIDLTDEILKATQEYENAWNEAYAQMEDRVNQFADKVEKALEPVKQLFYDISIGDWFAVGEDTSNIVSGIFNFFSDAIAKVDWQGVGNNIGLFLAGINWTEVFISIGKLIWEAINAVIDLLDGSFDAAPIEMAIISGIALLKWTGLGTIIFTGIKNAIKSKLSNIAEIFTEGGFLTNIGLVFENLFSGLSLKESMIAVFGELGTKIAGIGTVISGLILSVTNFIDMLNDGFSWFNEILMLVGIGLTTVGAIILGAPATVAAVVGGIVAAVATLVIVIKENWESIKETLFNFEWAFSFFKEAKNAFKNAFEADSFLEIGGWILKGILDGILGTISLITEPFYDLFQWIWVGICNIFGIASPAKEMEPLGEYILSGIVEGFTSSFSEMTEAIRKFYEEYIKPWFTSEKWKENMGSIKTALTDKWNEAKEWWNQKSDLEKITTTVEDFVTKIKNSWNDVKNWWKNNASLSEITAKIKIPRISLSWDTSSASAQFLQKLGLKGFPSFSVKYYATGGFPEDGWFRASKGEYFGKFDDGTSVIANNNQIISGIANGVRDANTEQNTLLREQNELLRQILAKDMGISSRDIFNTVRSEDNSYKRRNGHSAFAY